MKIFNKHITGEQIIDFVEGKLQINDSELVKDHLANCSVCQSEANAFRKIVNLMQTDTATDAPIDSIVWAKNLFKSKVTEPKQSFVKKVLAVLQMDLSQNQPAFAERSATNPVRQFLYQADDVSLDVRILKNEGLISVAGQILGEGFADCEIELSNQNISQSTKANELSEFRFSNLESGKYSLTIKKDDIHIVIEDFELI